MKQTSSQATTLQRSESSNEKLADWLQ